MSITTNTGAPATSAPEPGPAAGRIAGSTRQRILEISLELFTERGYDKTSVRDIAEQLGTTKAALYYYFRSKADILLELHLQLHELGARLLDELETLPDGPARAAAWPALLDRFITTVDEHRELVQLHQRNRTAFESLDDSERHHALNDEIEQKARQLLGSRDIPAAMRVRMACSIGAVMSGLLSGGFVDDVSHEQRIKLVREAVAAMFR